MKIDKVNDEFIVDCTNNTTEEKQQVYKFLVDNRDYGKIYLNSNAPIIVCNKKSGVSNWNTLEQYYNLFDFKKDLPVFSFEKFKEMYLEEEFILPARWCVRQDKQEINDWANHNRQTSGGYYYGLSGKWLFHFPKVDNFHLYPEVQHGYTLLTFEQFKKHILKQTEIEKEIIGYKAPYDLFGGKVKKGQIATAFSKPFSGEKAYHFKIEDLENTFSDTLPKEIVEQWELVYKEEFQVGDWVTFWSEIDKKLYSSKIKEWTPHNYCKLENGLEPFKHLIKKATPEEIEKASKTIVKMYSSNKGEFEIEIVGKKAYYRPDDKELTKEFIEEILDWFDSSNQHFHPSSSKLIYSLKVDSLKVGCMEGTRKANWQEVYDLIK